MSESNDDSVGSDLARLVLRVTVGGLLAGHGAQKLFGAFGGHGLKGTAGWLESIGMKPGSVWAPAAALSEFGGGVLTAAGLLNPIGPLTLLAPMSMATAKVHWGKPIWATEGGAELPVINMAVVGGLALAGPGRLSADRILGIRLPWPVVVAAAAATATGIVIGLKTRSEPASQADKPAGSETTAGNNKNGASPAPTGETAMGLAV